MSYLLLKLLSEPGPPPYIWKPPPEAEPIPKPKPGVMGGESNGDPPKNIPLPPPPPLLMDGAGPLILDAMGRLLPMGP